MTIFRRRRLIAFVRAMSIFQNNMAIFRRRKFIVVVSIGFLLFSAAILTSIYTILQHSTIISGDGPLPLAGPAFSETLQGDSHAQEDLYERFISNDFLQDDEDSLKSVQARMLARTNHVKTACAMMNSKGLSAPNQPLYQHEYIKHLIVDNKKKFMYCYLPKVANTNFRRVFLGLQGIVPKSEVPAISGYYVYFKYDRNLTSLISYKPLKRTQLLLNYKKFLVVRDPLERLLSGYRNKFFHPNKQHRAEYHEKVRAFYKLHPHLRRRNNVRVDFRSEELTFEEFLLYFTNVYEVNEFLNEHFVPSNQLCNPCKIQFDYIGKYESLNTDVKYIFDHLNIDIEFPGRKDNYSSVSTSSLVEGYYKPIPNWLLQKTWEIIKFDYLLFDYRLPEWYRVKLNKK